VRLDNQQDFQQKLFVHRKGAEIAEVYKKRLCVLCASAVKTT